MTTSQERIRVVLADDEEHFRTLVQRSLEGQTDIELVGLARNGREAIQLVNQLHPDVAFLDINMPVLNGLEASARIISLFPKTIIAILTAEQSKEFMREAMHMGVREYLDKSWFRAAEFPDIVRQVHARHAPAQAAASSRGLASVWSFYGPKGSAGATTQAVNAAVELAGYGYKVLLLDLDLATGDVFFYLKPTWLRPLEPPASKLLANLAAIQNLEERTVRQGIYRLDVPLEAMPAELRGHDFHLHVMPSPCVLRAHDAAAVQNLSNLIEFLTTLYDFIVLDLPPGRIFERSTALSLDFSEKVVLVANEDISSMKALHLFSRVLAGTAYSREKVTVALTQMTKDPELDAAAWLTKNDVFVHESRQVPLDPDTVHHSIASGVPYTLEDRETEVALFSRRLVEGFLNQRPQPALKQQLWTKLQGAVTQVFTA